MSGIPLNDIVNVKVLIQAPGLAVSQSLQTMMMVLEDAVDMESNDPQIFENLNDFLDWNKGLAKPFGQDIIDAVTVYFAQPPSPSRITIGFANTVARVVAKDTITSSDIMSLATKGTITFNFALNGTTYSSNFDFTGVVDMAGIQSVIDTKLKTIDGNLSCTSKDNKLIIFYNTLPEDNKMPSISVFGGDSQVDTWLHIGSSASSIAAYGNEGVAGCLSRILEQDEDWATFVIRADIKDVPQPAPPAIATESKKSLKTQANKMLMTEQKAQKGGK